MTLRSIPWKFQLILSKEVVMDIDGLKLEDFLDCIKVLSIFLKFFKRRLLKVHKRENFLGFDFEICTFS